MLSGNRSSSAARALYAVSPCPLLAFLNADLLQTGGVWSFSTAISPPIIWAPPLSARGPWGVGLTWSWPCLSLPICSICFSERLHEGSYEINEVILQVELLMCFFLLLPEIPLSTNALV
jgi:hypothetical protein